MIFREKCDHDYEVIEHSNAIQYGIMNLPLRLCIVKCRKCNTKNQIWLDCKALEGDV